MASAIVKGQPRDDWDVPHERGTNMRKTTFRLMSASVAAVAMTGTAVGLSAASTGHPAGHRTTTESAELGPSGGGCQPASADGYSVSACVSEQVNFAGIQTLLPDFYVTGLPAQVPNGCKMFWQVQDGGAMIAESATACTIGHKIVSSLPAYPGHTYTMDVQVWVPASDGNSYDTILDTSSPVQVG
jgi:hypothetical protein